MDDDEQEDLLVHMSDSDGYGEDSEAYWEAGTGASGSGVGVISGPPFRHSGHGQGPSTPYLHGPNRKRLELLGAGFVSLLSATALLVLLPLYLESSNRVADTYSSVLFTTVAITVVTFVCTCIASKFSSLSLKESVLPPFPVLRLVQLGCLHGVGGLCVMYALDRQRVVCHLQDPIKAVTLVFSMVYYFCFSKKLMGLQKIFCATTVIIGLFVSVDYALCDEFRCRGYERERVEDDTGHWSRATHFLWALNYIGGLALWSMHFSMLEGNIVALHLKNQLVPSNRTSLLETISCLIAHQDLEPDNLHQEGNEHLLISPEASSNNHNVQTSGESGTIKVKTSQHGSNPQNRQSQIPSTFGIVFWIYLVSSCVVLLCFWTDLVPSIGKSSSWSEFINKTQAGILCHFKSHSGLMESSLKPNDTVSAVCNSLAHHGWLFMASLLIFSVSSCHFLILCQSSVFTVALTTSALPLVNMFWSLFRLVPVEGGVIQWWPNFSPELVCTLLGVPVIATGLLLLCKAHWSNAAVQKELCCTLRYHPRTTLT